MGTLAYERKTAPRRTIRPVLSIAHLSPAKPPRSDPYGRDPPRAAPVGGEDEDEQRDREACRHYERQGIVARRERTYGRGQPRVEYLVTRLDDPSHFNIWMPKDARNADEMTRDRETRKEKMDELRTRSEARRAPPPRAAEPGEVLPQVPVPRRRGDRQVPGGESRLCQARRPDLRRVRRDVQEGWPVNAHHVHRTTTAHAPPVDHLRTACLCFTTSPCLTFTILSTSPLLT